MAKSPILGSAYVARSVNAADNRMVNLFPEIIPEGGKEPAFLSRAPGLRLLATVGDGPVRGLWPFGANLYVVSGTKLYKVDTVYAVTELGTVSGTIAPVSMANNGTQLFVACDGNSYIYNPGTGVFIQITDADFPGAGKVGYLDDYFVLNKPNDNELWVSALGDGLLYDATVGFAEIEGSPGDIVSLVVTNREVWIFKGTTTEVWYNAAGSAFPLAVIQGAFIDIGCLAASSVVRLDNSVFWLGRDSNGQGVVYRVVGYQAQRISTHSIEWQIQQYSTLSDAIAYGYQQDGHVFYVLTFPTADATWVYDVSTQAWHERAGLNNGEFVRHRGNCYAFFNGENILGDFENGKLYGFDLEVYGDNGAAQKWLRSWRGLTPDQYNLKRSAHHDLQIDCEVGVGIADGQGEDPQMMLRWSDDGGHTWSNEHWATMGAIGVYGTRVNWHRLGMTLKARDRVYEISGTDPVKIAIVGAELTASGTSA